MTSFEIQKSTEDPQFGIGIDIGTSTVKAYLLKKTQATPESKLKSKKQSQSKESTQYEIVAEIQEKNAQDRKSVV